MTTPSLVRRHRLAAAIGLLAVLAGCQDLDVTNPNNPDRARLERDPQLVQTIISSAYAQLFDFWQDDYPAWVLPTMADEFTSGFLDFGIHDMSKEPRLAFNNSPTYDEQEINRDPWQKSNAILSGLADAVAALESGTIVRDAGVDVTTRALAFAKLMQGITLGHVAMVLDSAYLIDEDFQPLPPPAPLPELSPYPEVLALAIEKLEEAAAIADTATFTLPGDPWLFVTGYSAADVAQLAHTFAARFLASYGRTRAERDAAPWDEVLFHAERGITRDLTPNGAPERLFHDFRRVAARQRTITPGDFARLDYWLVGPADSTNGMISWVNLAVDARNPFAMRTKDRRIQPPGPMPTDTTARFGKYFGYHRATIWNASRGFYHRTYYFYHRAGRGTTWETGPQLVLTVTEKNLLRAEALIRLDRADEAVPLINLSRVANGELDPVTIDGPPDVPGCVPRKIRPGPMQGQCGSLWDALRYEKRIEGAGIDQTTAYLDARGWQSLVVGTPLQFPVPALELQLRQQPIYSYGGVGGPMGAPAPDDELCPVALPRCP
ncbi:MAG TPA: hypothetical protein VH638_00095 [Gemmatimonadaceae bacterium]|jgi:hypothetical protein